MTLLRDVPCLLSAQVVSQLLAQLLTTCTARWVGTFFVLFVSLGASSRVHGSVYLSELYPAPTSGGSEWVELHNDSTQSATLDGWTLEDSLATPSTIYLFTSTQLEADEYRAVELTGSKLNNDADVVTLKNNQAETVHSISYEGSSPGTSWSVAAGGGLYESVPTPNSANAPQPSPSPPVSPTPHPSAPATSPPNPSPAETQPPALEFLSPSAVQLSEVMACPHTGEQEWIELFSSASNPGAADVILTDATGNTRALSATLNPGAYTVLSISPPLLNNTGDVTALTVNGTELPPFAYESCETGLSFQLLEGTWSEYQPSPGTKTVAPNTGTLTNPSARTQSTPAAVLSPTPKPSEPPTAKQPQIILPVPILQNEPPSPPAVSPQALTLSHPSVRLAPVISGILGGLLLLAAGWHGYEAHRNHSHHTHTNPTDRPRPPSTLGSPHFHIVGAERPSGV